MTKARQVLPGETYEITRRCVGREMWLVPRGQVHDIFGAAFAEAALKHQIDVHQITVMSNHYHAVITDPLGLLPDFMRDAHSQSAKGINAEVGRAESLWANTKYSAVKLRSEEDVMEALVYSAANPVRAGLVPTAAEWPGLRTLPTDVLGKGRVFKRTGAYLCSRLEEPPEKFRLPITVPPAFSHLSAKEFADKFGAALRDRERQIQAEMERDGKSFMGADKVRRQRRGSVPTTPREPRGELNPTIKAKNKQLRLDMIAELQQFHVDYEEARDEWLSGRTGVRMPEGTYAMATYPHLVPPKSAIHRVPS